MFNLPDESIIIDELKKLNPFVKVYIPINFTEYKIYGIILSPLVNSKFEESVNFILPENVELNYSMKHTPYDFYFIYGTKEQRDIYFIEQKEQLIAKEISKRYNIFDNENYDNNIFNKIKIEVTEELNITYKDLIDRISNG